MTDRIEQARDRFDVPIAMRKDQERRLRALLVPAFSEVLSPAQARELTARLIPLLQDDAARTAQDWLRRHQLGDRYFGWVDPTASPDAPASQPR